MTPKKNNTRRNILYVMMGVAVITVLVLLNGELDSKIADHPKIVGMEKTQMYMEEKIDTVISKQEVLNNKMDWMILEMGKLLMDEYP